MLQRRRKSKIASEITSPTWPPEFTEVLASKLRQGSATTVMLNCMASNQIGNFLLEVSSLENAQRPPVDAHSQSYEHFAQLLEVQRLSGRLSEAQRLRGCARRGAEASPPRPGLQELGAWLPTTPKVPSLPRPPPPPPPLSSTRRSKQHPLSLSPPLSLSLWQAQAVHSGPFCHQEF